MLERFTESLKKVQKQNRNHLALTGCFALLCLIALALRYELIPAQTFDFTHFLKPWHEYLNTHGLHAFHNSFANYNTPYLVLLWLTTLLPIGSLGAVKGISIIADITLATSIALVVSHYRPQGYLKHIAFLVVLFTPTVLFNGSLWGQCDGIYTSFLMFSLYAVLKNRPIWAWSLFGIAFAFKLQAIFFVPFLLFVLFYRRWKWYVPAYAVLTFCILSILPILEGRSLASTANIYIAQALHPTADQPMLSWFSPTFGQLLPSGDILYKYFKLIMLAISSAVAVGVIALAFVIKKLTDKQLLLLLAVSLFAIPFFLPGIHERYMFSAEIVAIICAFILPKLAWVAVAMQVVSIITYNSYFTGANQPPQLSYPILSLIVLGIIYTLGRQLQAELASADTLKLPK